MNAVYLKCKMVIDQLFKDHVYVFDIQDRLAKGFTTVFILFTNKYRHKLINSYKTWGQKNGFI